MPHSNDKLPTFSQAIPILRVADARVSETFYTAYFGFQTDWTHQFEEGFPLMMSISRDNACLFLSEHAGTGTDSCDVYIYVSEVDEIYRLAEIAGFHFEHKPVDQEWNVRELMFRDPDGHRITLGQKLL